ncbi:anti sigma factor C-terminal domain-containing protein [Clostridium sp. YIM B02505]|uniref:Anti sigma factor C-terminal domain-containing protein n=1 Tax=Clostridium yunnanense TaxID=2800325 RepID=A0ABS1EWS0_9CLOT|nr:anti sigma factor C-terminal domain-containing protein [Clostridium yunnanense]MBK1813764.1 anti sigma factor C-terminal domain-containing protein [Clostridium yunnanense]
MKDDFENKIDDLFDVNNKKTRKIILKAKLKSIGIFAIIIAVISSILYIVATRVVIKNIDSKVQSTISEIDLKLLDKKSSVAEAVEKEYEIMHPNRYLGQLDYSKGFLSADIKYDTYKVIGQNVVATEPIEREFNLKENLITEKEQEAHVNVLGKGVSTITPESLHDQLKDVDFFNSLGQRKMLFFYPFSDYKDLYRNDLQKLNEVDNKKIAEVAVSFDKYYSIEEVSTMIPKGVDITWYWVDTLSDELKSNVLKSDENDTRDIREGYDGTRKDGLFRRVVSEDSAIGIKAIDLNGYKIDKPVDKFVESLYRNNYSKGDLNSINSDQVNYLKKSLNIVQEDASKGTLKYDSNIIKTGGIVVTGSVELIKALKDNPHIKASTFGVIADKY